MTGAPIGVSVVCPGLIDTNIMRSSRNRPESLAEEGKAGPMAQAFGQTFLRVQRSKRRQQVTPEGNDDGISFQRMPLRS